jgi:hypothetical protein
MHTDVFFNGSIVIVASGKAKRMATISIIHHDETENEFEIDLCCEDCAQKDYGWTKEQYELVSSRADHSQPLRVPDGVNTERDLIEHIRTLCKGYQSILIP